MTHLNTDFAALVGSRICHDLISPVGAISNGIELLEMTGGDTGAEIALISDSVESANARIRFFRIAFGLADSGQTVRAREILSILRDITKGSRLGIDWQGGEAVPRIDLRPVFLAILCAEAACALGGMIRVSCDQGVWHICADSEKLIVDAPLWDALAGGTSHDGLTPNQVEFGLLPQLLGDIGKSLQVTVTPHRIDMRF